MYCKNCGMELKDYEKFCPNCGNKIGESTEDFNNAKANPNNVSQNNTDLQKYGFNGLLVWSIIELICCSRIFGIIALVILCGQLKPAVEHGNFVEADKSKSLIKILLIVGIVLGVVLNLFAVVAQFIPAILEILDVL